MCGAFAFLLHQRLPHFAPNVLLFLLWCSHPERHLGLIFRKRFGMLLKQPFFFVERADKAINRGENVERQPVGLHFGRRKQQDRRHPFQRMTAPSIRPARPKNSAFKFRPLRLRFREVFAAANCAQTFETQKFDSIERGKRPSRDQKCGALNAPGRNFAPTARVIKSAMRLFQDENGQRHRRNHRLSHKKRAIAVSAAPLAQAGFCEVFGLLPAQKRVPQRESGSS